MPDLLVTVTLYDAGPPATQISGPAMIKTLPTLPLQKVTAAFCRWLSLPEASVEFYINGQPLAGASSAEQAGVATGNAISARLVPGSEPPAGGFPQQFTMLDVTDSELSALADAMAVAR